EEAKKTTVTGVEMFRKLLDYAEAGDNIGALLRGVSREEISRGQVLAKPGSITPHTSFKSEVYVLSKDEGGRHTPSFENYRPQYSFRTTAVRGGIQLPHRVGLDRPGEAVGLDVSEDSLVVRVVRGRGCIREAGRPVGSGVVTGLEN